MNTHAATIILPTKGTARVKQVLSGDTVVLLGKPTRPDLPPPEVTFTLQGISAPRLQSKTNSQDEPGAFPAREFLRKIIIGQAVDFEVIKQGASAGDRVYGHVFFQHTTNETSSNNNNSNNNNSSNLAIQVVQHGWATPKPARANADAAHEEENENTYETQLTQAYQEAVAQRRGIHADVPLVRAYRSGVEDVPMTALTGQKLVCVVEHIFDGSRMRCQVVQEDSPLLYTNFTLLLAGITCPRMGKPDAPEEPFAPQARQFTTLRLLQRELPITIYGTDKNMMNAVGTVHHPAGNISVELLKNGLARMTDWSVRLMPVEQVPAYRVAENNAKRQGIAIWKNYVTPVLASASQMKGQVVEVLSGDTILVLPAGKAYQSEDDLIKVGLASIRAPRKEDPYALDCKERLCALVAGKQVSVDIHYERDIPYGGDGGTEKRSFGTVSTGKHEDVSSVLVKEGLALTQRHRDEDEKSPHYDELRQLEAVAKASKKGVHNDKEHKRGAVNDLTQPTKAKAYSGSLIRAKVTKAVVDFCFNGALFKLYIPAENCYIRFSPNMIRCPQPSPSSGSKGSRPAEPFGDESKRHARLTLLQRPVEIDCSGVTNSGIINGTMYVGQGSSRRDYAIEVLAAGLATLDQRKVDYGEVPKYLMDAQAGAQENKVGIWSIARPKAEASASQPSAVEKRDESIIKIRLCEIRSGSHFYFHMANDGAAKIITDSMQLFTQNHGTAGAPCDPKVGKVVAALFDDGTGKSWYRARIIERINPGKVAVVFLDFGNVATVPVATHLRPLDLSLGTDRIPAVAKEAILALTTTRPLNTDEGMDAARMLQSSCWGKDISARCFAHDDSGRLAIELFAGDMSEASVNVQMVQEGLARVAQPGTVSIVAGRMVNDTNVLKLSADLNVAQEEARRSRLGMWRYGDVPEDDPDDL